MLINEVTSIVGLSKKSIRYYEQQGLLSPNRNKENYYRIYNEKDIDSLKKIKFLRELDIPISDIKKLKENKLVLKNCLKKRVKQIDDTLTNYKKIKSFCLEIINREESYDNLDITDYLKEISILNKSGFTMRKLKINNKKKIISAFLSSFIFSLFFIFGEVVIYYFKFVENEDIPNMLFVFISIFFLLPLIGILITLISRIKEIIKGEEDEASKY